MDIVYIILKSITILVVFAFILPSIIHAHTMNSILKIPAFILLAFGAAGFMAWLNYIPSLIISIWGLMIYNTIQAMTESKFIKDSGGLIINRPLFYISEYTYLILSCALAYFFQVELLISTSP